MERPFVIAITGGAGAGKSTAARYFVARGAVGLDTDAIARDVLEEPDVRAALASAFGPGVLEADGSIDRAGLAEAAFRGKQSVARLNEITHPRITRLLLDALDELGRDPAVSVVVLEVPLLDVVPDIVARCDAVIAVEAPIGARLSRLVERGISEPDARRRISLQADDAERRRLADAVVVNDADPGTFQDRLDRIWEHFLGAGAAPVSGGPEAGG